MKKVVGIAAVAALLAVCASGTRAAWVEDFESYAPGALTLANSPWTGGHRTGDPTIVNPQQTNVAEGRGYGGSQGMIGGLNPGRNRAFRATDAGDSALSFQLRYGNEPTSYSAYREVDVRMATLDEYETAYGSSVVGACAAMEFGYNVDGYAQPAPYYYVRYTTYDSSGLRTIVQNWTYMAALNGNYVDFRMAVLGATNQIEFGFKRQADSSWTTVLGAIPTGFQFNYVNLEGAVESHGDASTYPSFDNVATSVPEPGALVALVGSLMGLGGFAIRRRS